MESNSNGFLLFPPLVTSGAIFALNGKLGIFIFDIKLLFFGSVTGATSPDTCGGGGCVFLFPNNLSNIPCCGTFTGAPSGTCTGSCAGSCTCAPGTCAPGTCAGSCTCAPGTCAPSSGTGTIPDPSASPPSFFFPNKFIIPVLTPHSFLLLQV